jgi:NAD(P)-dependent dehydrogenase (short-subunit alcohol dehydrogenase family)
MPASSPACTPSSTKTEDEDDRTMLVNFKSVWLGSKFAIRQMLPQDPVDGSRGRVVNIASIGGLVGSRPSQAIAPPRAPW